MPGPLPRRFPVVCPPHHRAAEEYENDDVFETCVTGRQRKKCDIKVHLKLSSAVNYSVLRIMYVCMVTVSDAKLRGAVYAQGQFLVTWG